MASNQGPATAHEIPTEALPTNDRMEVDDVDFTDSAFDSSDDQSSTTSVSSATYRGYIKNGRRYQSHGDYSMQPSDEKQWESLSAGHVLFLILDCQRENPLFRSPLGENAQNVLDLGTGSAEWVIGVGETFPNLTVHGVDLYPPPQQWVPPNVTLEVDDISKPWSWNKQFDLVHMRILMGSFDEARWTSLYQHAYDNLAPGGWIEHLEYDIGIFCDDNSMPADSIFSEEKYRSFFLRCASRAGRPLDTIDHLQRRITSAGFTNVQVQDYKMPVGTWPKHPIYKDAGRVNMIQMKTGLEGWLMYLMTAHGEPEPWTREEVLEYAERVREELKRGYHIYNKAKRVWAQKPY